MKDAICSRTLNVSKAIKAFVEKNQDRKFSVQNKRQQVQRNKSVLQVKTFRPAGSEVSIVWLAFVHAKSSPSTSTGLGPHLKRQNFPEFETNSS